MNSEVRRQDEHKAMLDQLFKKLTLRACPSSVQIRETEINGAWEYRIDWVEQVGSTKKKSDRTAQAAFIREEHNTWKDFLGHNGIVLSNHRSLLAASKPKVEPKDIRIEIDDESASPKLSILDLSKDPTPSPEIFRRCDGTCNRLLPKNSMMSFQPCSHLICQDCHDCGVKISTEIAKCCNSDCVLQALVRLVQDPAQRDSLFKQLFTRQPNYEGLFSELIKPNRGTLNKTVIGERRKLPMDEAEMRRRGFLNRKCDHLHPTVPNPSPKEVSVFEDCGLRSSIFVASPYSYGPCPDGAKCLDAKKKLSTKMLANK